MLSAEPLKQIDVELAKCPTDQCRSAIMGAPCTAQTGESWLVPETAAFVTDHIGIPPVQTYEVATFYNTYDPEPIGEYKLTACTNLPCALRGGVATSEYPKKKLGIGYGEIIPDGKFTLVEGEYTGACNDAPVILINNHSICSFMTEETVDKKLAEPE